MEQVGRDGPGRNLEKANDQFKLNNRVADFSTGVQWDRRLGIAHARAQFLTRSYWQVGRIVDMCYREDKSRNRPFAD